MYSIGKNFIVSVSAALAISGHASTVFNMDLSENVLYIHSRITVSWSVSDTVFAVADNPSANARVAHVVSISACARKAQMTITC